jgi:hypothetical protein
MDFHTVVIGGGRGVNLALFVCDDAEPRKVSGDTGVA